MIKPEANTLVIILPKGKPAKPSAACWGIVLEEISDNFYKVRVGKDPHNIIYVGLDQIIPFLQTDGSFADPQSVFLKNEGPIMLHLMLNFLVQQGIIQKIDSRTANLPEPVSVVPVEPGTLSIILPKDNHPSEACWGIVCRHMLGGNYEVQVGRFRHLRVSRIIVRPEQLVPVYLTNGSFKNPRQAIRHLREQLLLNMLLIFYSSQGSDFLRQIAIPLCKSDFVLVSRRGKKPPTPKKPE